MTLRPRTVDGLYDSAARVWLTAAPLSLLLPPSARRGVWLPLHLTLAGAVSVSISGRMQTFAGALTATPAPPAGVVVSQFCLMNVGAGLIAGGYPAGVTSLLAAGGSLFLLGILILGWILWRAWRTSVNRRHVLPMTLYGLAGLSLLAGGTLGAVIGSGAVHDGATWLALRRAHLTLNVLGWASLSIVATVITLLPTILRVRMPRWEGTTFALVMVIGLGLLAGGLAGGSDRVAALGGAEYAAGALGVGWMAILVLRTPRRWGVPAAARHLFPALCWLLAGSLALTVAAARGPSAFEAFIPVFLVAIVCGWVVQTLLGAWLYLLPMARAGSPTERRHLLAAMSYGATLHAIALNVGLALLALRGAGLVPSGAGRAGAVLALAGGGTVLLKAWAIPLLLRAP